MMVLQQPDLISYIMAIFFRTILMEGILIKILLRGTILTMATLIIRILKSIWMIWTMLIA